MNKWTTRNPRPRWDVLVVWLAVGFMLGALVWGVTH